MSDHAKWDLPKIREACLALMGWKRVMVTGSGFEPYPNGDWDSPSGDRCSEESRGRQDDMPRVPDPTHSLDDASPLFDLGKWTDKPSMSISRYRSGDDSWWEASFIGRQGRLDGVIEDSAPLAVCLCALRCAGRNLDDFKVKP